MRNNPSLNHQFLFQVERLNERNSKLLDNSDSRERDEMHALRSDLRTLRDRNQQVNEENIHLREEMRDLRQRTDESLRKLRHSAPSPKFHDTSLVGSGWLNGMFYGRDPELFTETVCFGESWSLS
jgi:ElaB/YqjD/DUF883 family membrane-anchored ribosome-binding protein